MVLLMAALPLQWFVVVGSLRLHLVAMFVFAAIVTVVLRGRAFLPVLKIALPFVVANLVLVSVWFATNLYNGIGIRQPVQQALYVGVMITVGTVIYRSARDRSSGVIETLRWAGLITTVSMLTAMSVSMSANGVNPGEVFANTIASGDPQVLQRELFRSSFNGFGIDEDSVRGNIRHEVFGAVLVSMALSAACVGLRPFVARGARILFRCSMVLSTALLLVSLSRSIMIAAGAWLLLGLLRSLLAGRLSPRVVGGMIVAAGAVVLLGAVGLLNVLWIRFTEDTGSYKARDNLMELAFRNIVENMLTGGVATQSASSHNFVIDTWLRAGVFAAAASLVATVLVVGLLFWLALNLHLEPRWMVPTTALLVLPAVRLFTAGGGLIPPVSWVALGLAAGLIAYRAHRVSEQRAARQQESTGLPA